MERKSISAHATQLPARDLTLFESAPFAHLSVVPVSNNYAYNGAVYTKQADLSMFNNTKMWDNIGDHDGAGVYMNDGELTIDGADIRGNSAPWGGAVYFKESLATITRTYFGRNTANVGGAIRARTNSVISILDSIFEQIEAETGGKTACVFGRSRCRITGLP